MVRGDREIGNALDFGLFTRHPHLNYFRGEIRFPPITELNRLFGIEPDKAKFQDSWTNDSVDAECSAYD